jgi:putative acetyltransferase
MTMTVIRPYVSADAQPTLTVFRRAVRMTAAADYTPEQIAAWVGAVDMDRWADRRGAAGTWIAERECDVVGFTDVDSEGYIDMMYVDPAVGRGGVATALLGHVRKVAATMGANQLTVNASATARPFFARHGFVVQIAQEVERNGIVLQNFRMTATIT